jgi:hypothetical protein
MPAGNVFILTKTAYFAASQVLTKLIFVNYR